MTQRDRDADGRARNARARDEFGRPLPRGAMSNVPQIPDDADYTPTQAVQLAQELLDQRLPFYAHEVFEAMWKASAPEGRRLWRGLAQVAVGLTHVQRQNSPGALALLRRGVDALSGADPHYGIDIESVADQARVVITELAAGRTPRPEQTHIQLAPT